MPHLVFVVNNADFLVSHRLVLVQGALKAGYRVTAIAPEGPGLEVLSGVGCDTVTWRLRRTGQRPHEEALALAQLGALYRRLKPDLVHHITVKAMLYGSLAARATGVRAVVNAVSGLGYVFLSSGLRARLRRQALRAGYRMALTTPGSAVILQNDDDEASLRELGVLEGARIVKIRGSRAEEPGRTRQSDRGLGLRAGSEHTSLCNPRLPDAAGTINGQHAVVESIGNLELARPGQRGHPQFGSGHARQRQAGGKAEPEKKRTMPSAYS